MLLEESADDFDAEPRLAVEEVPVERRPLDAVGAMILSPVRRAVKLLVALVGLTAAFVGDTTVFAEAAAEFKLSAARLRGTVERRLPVRRAVGGCSGSGLTSLLDRPDFGILLLVWLAAAATALALAKSSCSPPPPSKLFLRSGIRTPESGGICKCFFSAEEVREAEDDEIGMDEVTPGIIICPNDPSLLPLLELLLLTIALGGCDPPILPP